MKQIINIQNRINKFVVNSLLNFWISISQFIKSDVLFLKIYYLIKMKERLNINNPRSYTQKVQWLKVHNNSVLYSNMVDKYTVKKIVSGIIGDNHIISLIGVWDKFEDINFDSLPDQFVLKTTHDSGNVVICKNKKELDIEFLRLKFNKALRMNYFYKSREYPYKNVVPRLIAEEYMIDKNNTELIDYKFFCFHGEPKFVQITDTVNGQRKVSYFDMEFNLMPFTTDSIGSHKFDKPAKFNEMIDIACKLSKDIIHVRIDLYVINNQVYFGEFTFHNNGGIVIFNPKEWNNTIGGWININQYV